jgi:putative CocE/NonD family hydrolase
MNRFFVGTLIIFAGIVAFEGSARLAQPPDVTIERDVEVKMRDGVILRADIYRPKAPGKYPVLLERTPYDKLGEIDFGPEAAAHGFVAIVQDVRGRFRSDGEWYVFKHESQDGYDTVEWAAALPYSNGKIAMWGGSYVGATQMLAAIAQPPHLVGICPRVTPSNYHNGWTYQGGAFEQWFSQSWTSGLAQNTLARQVGSSNAMNWATNLPLADYPYLDLGTRDALAPYYRDWLDHPDYDDYWKAWSIEDNFSKIQVPGFHVAGWYDIFQGGALHNYSGIRAQGATDAARQGQRLVVGPWWHGPFDGKAGELDFGPTATSTEAGVTLRWYEYLLKGVKNGLEREKPVKIFVMGANVWREENEWPLARAVSTKYYLHSGSHANSLEGDGTLSTTAPADEPHDEYEYDPADPVPTRGGGLCCDNTHQPSGAFDQRKVESRKDVLVYSTQPFDRDVEITGPISVEAYVSSSAADTDFTAKLIDVWPNGFAQNLTDGILRARYRNSHERPELMTPGQVYRVTIDAWATSNLFKAGHRLRVDLSSSNFPRFDRNLNTGESGAHSSRMVKAINAIYHDREHPSALVVPVVGR